MACYIFGAGSFYGLDRCPRADDFIIAADGGWLACRKAGITPDLLLGDFDSLSTQPDFPNILRVPVEKDDTDTMLAVKTGLERGETEFHTGMIIRPAMMAMAVSKISTFSVDCSMDTFFFM